MARFKEMSNEEMAHCLNNWMCDAANAWDYFSDEEKRSFRMMQDEACKRFIAEHLAEREICGENET